MGEIISKQAATDDIMADIHTTLAAARARGGAWATDGDTFLGQVLAVADRATTERDQAEAEARPLRLTLAARDAQADDLILKFYDETYNLLGRPGYDPLWSLLYPGGASAYTEGNTMDQPERMELLVTLLRSNVHPGIPDDRAKIMATELEVAAADLKEAVNALVRPSTRAAHFDRLRQILARSGQVQLSRLKRHWKGQGRSEADIHQVIPDRPRRSKAATDAPAPSDAA